MRVLLLFGLSLALLGCSQVLDAIAGAPISCCWNYLGDGAAGVDACVFEAQPLNYCGRVNCHIFGYSSPLICRVPRDGYCPPRASCPEVP